MIRQYLSNKNESATVAKIRNFFETKQGLGSVLCCAGMGARPAPAEGSSALLCAACILQRIELTPGRKHKRTQM